jgi:uncharacterized protein (DUF433 family)
MDEGESWLGIGLYTASEASRLLQLPAARVRRWLGGYSGAKGNYPPLWNPQLSRLDDQLGLGFLDLMQLRIVDRIVRKTEISLQALRKALDHIRDLKLIDHHHPLATARFQTDGSRIFLETGHEVGEPILYDVLGKQYGFHRVIAPSFKDVDLDLAITRWWPLGKQRTVVIDPERSFGAPVASGSGVPTATLALAVEREGSTRAVTRWYPVTEREVRDAFAFERRLAASPPRQLAA